MNLCCLCGTTNNLTQHSIDFDINNRTPDNLITLCQSCHSKAHGTKKQEYYRALFYEWIAIREI